jgi:hypothetical protein
MRYGLNYPNYYKICSGRKMVGFLDPNLEINKDFVKKNRICGDARRQIVIRSADRGGSSFVPLLNIVTTTNRMFRSVLNAGQGQT